MVKGAKTCNCISDKDHIKCANLDTITQIQTFSFDAGNVKPSKKVQMKNCQGYLSIYRNLFNGCYGCDMYGGPQFKCQNEPIIDVWCDSPPVKF